MEVLVGLLLMVAQALDGSRLVFHALGQQLADLPSGVHQVLVVPGLLRQGVVNSCKPHAEPDDALGCEKRYRDQTRVIGRVNSTVALIRAQV